jgi:hypothetical protein
MSVEVSTIWDFALRSTAAHNIKELYVIGFFNRTLKLGGKEIAAYKAA